MFCVVGLLACVLCDLEPLYELRSLRSLVSHGALRLLPSIETSNFLSHECLKRELGCQTEFITCSYINIQKRPRHRSTRATRSRQAQRAKRAKRSMRAKRAKRAAASVMALGRLEHELKKHRARAKNKQNTRLTTQNPP